MTTEWVPSACTLPTPEQPRRVAEFDALFAAALRPVERPEAHRLRLTLAEDLRASVEDLITRETACCSFFTFTLAPGDPGELRLDVAVPATRLAVLDALFVAAARSTIRDGRGPGGLT